MAAIQHLAAMLLGVPANHDLPRNVRKCRPQLLPVQHVQRLLVERNVGVRIGVNEEVRRCLGVIDTGFFEKAHVLSGMPFNSPWQLWRRLRP